MTFAIGSPAMASPSASCRACASGTEGVVAFAKTISAFPSMRLRSEAGSTPESPADSSFFRSAGVGLPAASSATATGMSFTSTCLGSDSDATSRMTTASRRGVANILAATSFTNPRRARPLTMPLAKASPNFRSERGGSSSQRISMSSGARLTPPSSAAAESPAARATRSSSAPRPWRACGYARCSRRARSPKWRRARREG